jgi:hypothetical protein
MITPQVGTERMQIIMAPWSQGLAAAVVISSVHHGCRFADFAPAKYHGSNEGFRYQRADLGADGRIEARFQMLGDVMERSKHSLLVDASKHQCHIAGSGNQLADVLIGEH